MRAKLHHISRFNAEDRPSRWAIFLHGILGSGANWARFATELAQARPDWGFICVDLRHHGRSEKGQPPDGVTDCVEDLLAFFQSERVKVDAVIGHSFGSKIALQLTTEITDIDFCAIIDSDPGVLDTEGKTRDDFPVLRLMDVLSDGPDRYPSREDFVQKLAEAGFREGVAGWVGKNLKRTETGLVLDLDLERIEAMLEDHHRLDLWGLVETPMCRRLEFYLGSRSKVVPESSIERMASVVAAMPDQVDLQIIEGAGHWVHVDAPDVLLNLLLAGISE